MTTYQGRCHCGQTEWTTKLDGGAHILWYGSTILRSFLIDISSTDILCVQPLRCLQVALRRREHPESDGQRGRSKDHQGHHQDVHLLRGLWYCQSLLPSSLPFAPTMENSSLSLYPMAFLHPIANLFFAETRQAGQLLLLPQLHIPHLPPPDRPRSKDRRSHGVVERGQKLPSRGRDFRQGQAKVAACHCGEGV